MYIMSIATLKRKTQTKYNNMSVGQTGFSINGTHRNQGYVGQTSLSRSLPRTLMRGNTVRGHGGCCGTFTVGPIIQSGVTSTEDSSVVKTSTLGTSGMLSTKYRWIRRPEPFATVKSDNNNNRNAQSDYITRLAKKTLFEIEKAEDPLDTTCKNLFVAVRGNCTNYDVNYKQSVCSIVKPESDYLPISSGAYIMKINDSCTKDDITVATNVNKTPFFGFN
jgi:hypothetical protein